MKKRKKVKIFFSDLKPLFKKCLIIIADYSNVIFPDKNNDEKGFIYPHNSFYSDDNILATVVIYRNKITDIDDFCITLLHELIHLYLYTKNIHDHDESFIEHEAERIYRLEKNNILKFIKKHYNINYAVS